MKKVYCIFWVFVLAFAKANSQPAFNDEVDDTNDIKEIVEVFFTAFHNQDTKTLKTMFIEEATLYSISLRKDVEKKSSEKVDRFLKSISSIPTNVDFMEEIHDVIVTKNQYTATANTPYTFYVDQKKSHSGNNIFVFIKMDGLWKITSITDSRVYK